MSTPESTAEPRTEATAESGAEAPAPGAEAAAEPGAEAAAPSAEAAELSAEAPELSVEAAAEPNAEAPELNAEAPELSAEATEASAEATEAMPAAWPAPMPEPGAVTTAEPGLVTTAEPGPVTTAEPGPVTTAEPGPVTTAEPRTEAISEALRELTPEAMPDAWPEAMPDAWPEAMPDAKQDLQAFSSAQAAVEAEAVPAAGPAAADAIAAGMEAGSGAPGDDLRAAVGLPEKPAPRDAQPRGPRRRIALLIGVLALLGVVVAGLVFLGQQNQQRYFLVCGEDDITAAQGRSFPPWGQSALAGKAWQAIPRPLDASCEDRVFDSREGLARSFGETLVARAEAWVTAREGGAGRERLAEAQAQLDQAQRVLRELREPGAGLPELSAELSGKLQRLRGDLDYWQARDRIDTAMAELARAAEHLDSAVAHDPHHNRENAMMWQRVVARLQAELGRGAAGFVAAPVPDPTDPAPDLMTDPAAPDAATGDALPATPEIPGQPGTDSPSIPSGDSPDTAGSPPSDAGPTSAPPVPGTTIPATPPPPPDAGVRRGGLLI